MGGLRYVQEEMAVKREAQAWVGRRVGESRFAVSNYELFDCSIKRFPLAATLSSPVLVVGVEVI